VRILYFLPLAIVLAFMVMIFTVNGRQKEQLDRGERVSATRLVTGCTAEVLATVAATASSRHGANVSVTPPGVVTWTRRPSPIHGWGYVFRADVRPASPSVEGKPVSEVSVGFRLRFGYDGLGIGWRMVQRLLDQIVLQTQLSSPEELPKHLDS
jgi:hypothetical protein